MPLDNTRDQGKRKAAVPVVERTIINPPNIQRATVEIVGTAPLVSHKFGAKATALMQARQQAGDQARKNRKREARNFDADLEAATHRADEGWPGIPASAFRNALISACKVVGFAMTRAKLSVFVEADGIDATDGTPLIRIRGEIGQTLLPVRNETGVADLRIRPIWKEWKATLTLRFDGDQFSATDVMNLVARAGLQVGVGEGRPDSKRSNGMGWGLWELGR